MEARNHSSQIIAVCYSSTIVTKDLDKAVVRVNREKLQTSRSWKYSLAGWEKRTADISTTQPKNTLFYEGIRPDFSLLIINPKYSRV